MRVLSIIAATLAAVAATPAHAEDATYVLEYTRIGGPSGSATAIAVLDDALLINDSLAEPVDRSTMSGFEELASFELTISGTGFIDGTYDKDDLAFAFSFDAPLDPTQELLGQETAIGPGGDFNFTLSDGGLISAVDINTFGAEIRDITGVILEQARFRLASFTPVPMTDDTDGDSIADDADNCTEVANPGQTDTDTDGIGNACDPDFTQDCMVNFGDLAVLKSSFLSTDALTDLNDDGQTNFGDLAVLRSFFPGAPGPSGLETACD